MRYSGYRRFSHMSLPGTGSAWSVDRQIVKKRKQYLCITNEKITMAPMVQRDYPDGAMGMRHPGNCRCRRR